MSEELKLKVVETLPKDTGGDPNLNIYIMVYITQSVYLKFTNCQ